MEALSDKLDFLDIRIKRIEPQNENEQSQLKGLKTKFESLQCRVANISVSSERDPADQSLPVEKVTVLSQNQVLASSSRLVDVENRVETVLNDVEVGSRKDQRHSVPVWKWNTKYTGDPKGISASDFVRKVNDLAKSRNVSEVELASSAVELFEGTTLKWYHALSHTGLITWKELSNKLIRDFESPEYIDDLLDFIKSRKQAQKESIVTFFATMEDMFLKLESKLSDADKIKILKKNVLPEYSRSLALATFASVNDLKEACKTLEHTFAHTPRVQSHRSQEGQAFGRINAINFQGGGSSSHRNEEIQEQRYGNNMDSGARVFRTQEFHNTQYHPPKRVGFQGQNRRTNFNSNYHSNQRGYGNRDSRPPRFRHNNANSVNRINRPWRQGERTRMTGNLARADVNGPTPAPGANTSGPENHEDV